MSDMHFQTLAGLVLTILVVVGIVLSIVVTVRKKSHQSRLEEPRQRTPLIRIILGVALGNLLAGVVAWAIVTLIVKVEAEQAKSEVGKIRKDAEEEQRRVEPKIEMIEVLV